MWTWTTKLSDDRLAELAASVQSHAGRPASRLLRLGAAGPRLYHATLFSENGCLPAFVR